MGGWGSGRYRDSRKLTVEGGHYGKWSLAQLVLLSLQPKLLPGDLHSKKVVKDLSWRIVSLIHFGAANKKV